jgi:5-methylcytosine-specific restriction endonuclease McrA
MRHATVPLTLITLLALGALRHGARRRHSLRYRLYLRSPMWRMRRRLWILQARGRCQDCGRWWGRRLTIHHLTYRRLGHERRKDIRVLCWRCHHARHDFRPTTEQ